MKKQAWMIWMAMAATPYLGVAQVDPAAEPLPEEPLATERPWRFGVDALNYTAVFQHDALQTRADYELDEREGWRDGDSSGQGWGLRLTVGRELGLASMRFIMADLDYERSEPDGYQTIKTDRRDLELKWNQGVDQKDFGEWGWMLGFRYVGLRKNMEIVEGGDDYAVNDQINYYMLQAGYYGQWYPFGGPNLRVFGQFNGLFGEGSGLARSGTDQGWDGNIEETYDSEYSLAYGLNFDFGVMWEIPRGFRASVSYGREWIYSFDATNTGLVVFPDNSDALFIENTHQVLISVGWAF